MNIEYLRALSISNAIILNQSDLLYEEYCRLVKNPVIDRAYRNYMKRMVELDL